MEISESITEKSWKSWHTDKEKIYENIMEIDFSNKRWSKYLF